LLPFKPLQCVLSQRKCMFELIQLIFCTENIVVPNQQQYHWYHRKYRRVPTVDQCYERDDLCIWEADMQFTRDKYVAFNQS